MFALTFNFRSILIDWPPRSPDLTPLDFFLWGVLKDKVFKRKPKTIIELKTVICEEIKTINDDKELLTCVCNSIKDRLEACIKYEGQQIENFL